MQKHVSLISDHSLPGIIDLCYKESSKIAVVLDQDLVYLAANSKACERLGCKEDDLIGRNILDIYPQMIASENHRNLLSALDGKTITAIIHTAGVLFEVLYCPFLFNEKVEGIFVVAKKITQRKID